MTGAYTGTVAVVDLSNGAVTKESLPEEFLRNYVGGRGLGARLLWEWTKQGIDPIGPDNIIMFLTGPLTGIGPGTSQVCLVFKSPATAMTLGHALSGANWGPELKFAGYDGLIVKGKSPRPVYILIDNDKIEIRDAGHLWGKGSFATEDELKKELRDPLFRIMSIGPAGENLVRFASVQQEYFRSAARGGPGAVMGSKNLKAVVVRGSEPLNVADPETYYAARKVGHAKLADGRAKMRRGYTLKRWGSTISTVSHSDVSELNVRNYRDAWWDDVDKTGGIEYERRCRVKSRSCYSCPVSCMQLGVIREGPYAGYTVNPDFDSTGTIGPGCLLTDLNGMVYLSRLGDDLGMDDASLGNTVGFAMECYEKGLLSQSDLDGIDLRWGNVEAMVQMWHKIARREGIGDLLAEGVKRAAQKIGGGSEKFAMHVKGLEFAGYAPHAHADRGLQYAVGDRGGCHHFGLTMTEQNHRIWADSLTACSWHRSFIEPQTYVDMLNPAAGWNLTVADWDLIANRMLTISRAYNIREGMRPLLHDVLPDRIHSEALRWGPKAGSYYPRDKFEADREAWYKERGYDAAGIPTDEILRNLGLEFTIPELEKVRAESVASGS